MVITETTYYDTGDLRLTQAGIEVRRCAAEWVVALPAEELRFALVDGEPEQQPAEVRTLLIAYTAGRDLRPCAQVTVERDPWQLSDADGTVLADVHSDQVTARPLGDRAGRQRSWQVTEVRPRGENPAARARMAKRLARSGWSTEPRRNPLTTLTGVGPADEVTLGKKPSVADVLGRYVTQQLAAMRVADVALRRGDADGVHDLRVAVRRLRTCLRVFGKYFEPVRLTNARAELAWLFDVLGEARDVEVLRERITDGLHALPDDLVLGPVSSELDRFLARREADTDGAVHEAIGGARYVTLLNLLETMPCRPSADRRAKKELPKRIRKSFGKLRTAVDAASEASGAERDAALHSVRKKAKRLRYTCEIAEPVLGAPSTRIRRESKQVQRILGEHHDSVELRAVLRGLGGQAHLDGTNGFTFGVLHGEAGQRAIRHEADFAEQWDRLTDAVSAAV
jgi:CHAD domain-containing protein